MTACEVMIGIEIGNNETRAQKFLRNANELLDNKATVIHCPNDDCYNGYVIAYCDCLGDPKCWRCYGKGVVAEACPECRGQGEVLAYPDGRREALI